MDRGRLLSVGRDEVASVRDRQGGGGQKVSVCVCVCISPATYSALSSMHILLIPFSCLVSAPLSFFGNFRLFHANNEKRSNINENGNKQR